MPTFTVETISVTEVCPGDTVLAGGVPEKITRVAEIDATANNLLMMGKSTRIRLYSRKDLIAEVPLSTTVCRLVEDVVCVPGGRHRVPPRRAPQDHGQKSGARASTGGRRLGVSPRRRRRGQGQQG